MKQKVKETLMWFECFTGYTLVGTGLTFLSFALWGQEYSWELLWLALPIGLGVLLFADAAKTENRLINEQNKYAKKLNNYGKNI